MELEEVSLTSRELKQVRYRKARGLRKTFKRKDIEKKEEIEDQEEKKNTARETNRGKRERSESEI